MRFSKVKSSKLKFALMVGLGSFLGGIALYLLSMLVQQKTTSSFPFGTFIGNLTGCFVIGCLLGLSEKRQLGLETRLFFIIGLLGGFTTFSAFSAETHFLFRTGHFGIGISYVITSIVIGIGLTIIGHGCLNLPRPSHKISSGYGV
jgi:CrcB protein